ncbi:40S small subunit processome assembly factor 1 [Neosynchiropus ocellatus]
MDGNKNGGGEEDQRFLERVLEKLYDFGNGSRKKQKKSKRTQREEEEEDEAEPGCGGPTASEGRTAPSVQPQQVEVVTFQDPTKRQRSRQPPATLTAAVTSSGRPEDLTLEKARLEVHRFGITGYKKEQQRVFEQDRAIMLGARPPKRPYTNYKVLQQQIKEKKQRSSEEADPDLKKKKRKKSKTHRDKKASTGSDSAPMGQMGRFKNGMLILSSQEIQKVKGKPGSRSVTALG